MAQERPHPPDSSEQDDLFGKLDELIGKHQGRAPRRLLETPLPTLTEAVSPSPQQLEIPVLNEVVEIPSRPAGEPPAVSAADSSPPLIDKRKQLQVALYLRLRQRLDEELQAALAAQAPPRLGDAAAPREVTVMAEKSLPYAVLRKIVASCSAADYSKVSLAVVEREQALAMSVGA